MGWHAWQIWHALHTTWLTHKEHIRFYWKSSGDTIYLLSFLCKCGCCSSPILPIPIPALSWWREKEGNWLLGGKMTPPAAFSEGGLSVTVSCLWILKLQVHRADGLGGHKCCKPVTFGDLSAMQATLRHMFVPEAVASPCWRSDWALLAMMLPNLCQSLGQLLDSSWPSPCVASSASCIGGACAVAAAVATASAGHVADVACSLPLVACSCCRRLLLAVSCVLLLLPLAPSVGAASTAVVVGAALFSASSLLHPCSFLTSELLTCNLSRSVFLTSVLTSCLFCTLKPFLCALLGLLVSFHKVRSSPAKVLEKH